LEIGTASGYLGRELRRRGFVNMIGVEQDPELAREAQPHYHCCYVGDVGQDGPWPWDEEGGFDALICADVLEHLPDPAKVLARLSQLVRPSGQVVISLPNAVNWTVRLMVLSGRFDYTDCGLLDRGHLRFFTRRTACQLIEQGGLLRVCRTYVTPLPFGRMLEHQLPRWAIEAIERLYAGAALCWKNLFAYQFVFLAERVAE